MLAALFRQADRVWQHHHRVDFRAVGDRIETASVGEFAGQRLRRLDEAGAQRTHHCRRQRAVEHGAGAIMLGRVALEYEARRAPRRFAREIAEANAAARTERRRIAEHFLDLAVARGGVGFVSPQPHDRPRLAQGFLGGVGIAQKVD
jgi:hypothetical protein